MAQRRLGGSGGPRQPWEASRLRGSLEPAPTMLPGLASQRRRAWGPGARCCGSGSQGLPSLAVAPSSSPCLRAPPPTCPCSAVGVGEVVDDLCLGLCPGPPGQVALIRVPLLSDGPSGACGRGLGGQREPPRGPGGCLTSLAFACPAPTPPPRAAPFTTSGYRTLHEFRSQWNYFRILVNRKLGVFHKLSITAVWWAEPGPGP